MKDQLAEDIMRITVDCKENPLLCEIANDEGREDLVAMRRGRTWKHYGTLRMVIQMLNTQMS